jgi:hypothetical protein
MVLAALALPATADVYVLSTGIANYQALGSADYADTDAQSVGGAIAQLCPPGQSHIRYLINEQATKAAIAAAFAELARAVGPSDVVVLYFAGHGRQVPDGDGDEGWLDPTDETLVPYDATDDPQTQILDDDLGRWVSDIPSSAVIFVVDACHGGGQARRDGGSSDASSTSGAWGESLSRDLFSPGNSRGRVFLAACRETETAYSSNDWGAGVFTHYLVDELGGAFAARTPRSLRELFAGVRQGVRDFVKAQFDDVQVPVLSNPDGLVLSLGASRGIDQRGFEVGRFGEGLTIGFGTEIIGAELGAHLDAAIQVADLAGAECGISYFPRQPTGEHCLLASAGALLGSRSTDPSVFAGAGIGWLYEIDRGLSDLLAQGAVGIVIPLGVRLGVSVEATISKAMLNSYPDVEASLMVTVRVGVFYLGR